MVIQKIKAAKHSLYRKGLMITIISMGVIMNPAEAVIKIVGRYYKSDGRNKQPGFVVDEK
jgi:hypothetical protein